MRPRPRQARRPRRARRTLLPAALALALLPAGLTAAAASATAAPGPGPRTPQPAAPARQSTVTLVTGDEVTVTRLGGGKQTVTVDRPRGASGAVRTRVVDGRVTVVPDEARPYLRAGVLDERLFDVSELIRQGAGVRQGARGAASGGLPLVVTYEKDAPAARAAPRGTRQVRSLPSIRGAALKAAPGPAFWRGVTGAGKAPRALGGGIAKVWLDGRVRADMAASNAQIGTPEAWQAGLTGKGVKVAVLDTGVDATHPDLKGRVGATKSFVPGEEVADRGGHGTHVTSTVGGSGAASDGKEKGVAPGAELAVGKVLSDDGFGSESQIVAGMEWAARDVDARIVSLSLGSSEPSDGTDPMAAAVNALTKETGALFVVAAGNTGAPSSIGSPAAADSALTVGAVDSADEAAYFTSQGPRHGDRALKPDLSAPGVDILAARSRLTPGQGDYTTMSGTSMATPHVTGVAALLAERHPDWSGQRLKDALMSTSHELDASAYTLGAGRVDVPSAIGAKVTATGAADLGFHPWPYDENKPVRRTVTYTNAADEPVELSLAAEGAAEGVVTLADTKLTVPAHGTVATTVTGDGARAPVGNTSGRIVASAGGERVAHTVFGLVKEEERYTLTLRVKDRDGAPTGADVVVHPLAKGADPTPAAVGGSGELKLRLKPGAYSLSSFLDVRGAHGADSLGLGFLAAPEVTLDRDRTVTLDARELREITAKVPRRSETRQLLMEAARTANGSSYQGAVQVPVTYDSVFAAPTPKVRQGTFAYRTVWRLGKPVLDVEGIGAAVAQPGGTVADGRSRLKAFDAGDGTPGAYAGKDARGKAAVVRRTGAAGQPTPAALARAAQDAGAEALFVTDGVPGRLNAWFGTDDNADRPLTIATVGAADGARLLAAARAGRTLETTGTPYTPYVYDLEDGFTGAVPDRPLTYAPGKRELAVLDAAFHAPARRATPGGEFRYSLTDTFPVGLGFLEKIAYPAERTDYVASGKGRLWHETVHAGPTALEQRGGLVDYRGGRRTGLDWFKPLWHPWLGSGLGWGQERTGDDLAFNVPGWGDSGPDHTGFGDVWNDDSMTQVSAVYADGELVDRRKSSGVYVWDAAPEERTYKVVTDTTLSAERWRLATEGHAEWTVRSARTPADRRTVLPVLNLGFDVDTDLYGDVRGGRTLPVGLSAAYVRGAADTGSVRSARLEVSYDDGASWAAVPLRRDGSSWKGKLRVPRGAGAVSLRGSASDDRGGSVTQEILRGVGVR
ncbi:S8 family serine peptidase [Streptomyces sp. AN091965]|uniref:S8 family serine peptidase n=1 Tax=Streptomyces sp. AN091965 TaxID=2927803 RepID=UPI001F60D0BD|nr:S8 family serine peptidase [Streptomyces sp. AN091965]MCI3930472.1 S8 family serine peptidase [Streptomyces sp. AN091965]